MYFETYNFRNALAILDSRPEWEDLKSVLEGIRRQDIIDTQRKLAATGRRAPAGAQRAINSIFKERLPKPEWFPERRLFDEGEGLTTQDRRRWAMDFVRRGNPPEGGRDEDFGLGVEVSFNHVEAMAWTLVRLDLASEGTGVQPNARIDVGVAIYASSALKKWGSMDSSVGTYEQACQWLELMRPVIPLPIALVGLHPSDSTLRCLPRLLQSAVWAATGVFPGTGSRN